MVGEMKIQVLSGVRNGTNTSKAAAPIKELNDGVEETLPGIWGAVASQPIRIHQALGLSEYHMYR